MVVIEFILDLLNNSIIDLLLEFPTARLQTKIKRKAKTHHLSAQQLNEIGELFQDDIKDNGFGGFDFIDCSYVDLKRLWYNLRHAYP